MAILEAEIRYCSQGRLLNLIIGRDKIFNLFQKQVLCKSGIFDLLKSNKCIVSCKCICKRPTASNIVTIRWQNSMYFSKEDGDESFCPCVSVDYIYKQLLQEVLEKNGII